MYFLFPPCITVLGFYLSLPLPISSFLIIEMFPSVFLILSLSLSLSLSLTLSLSPSLFMYLSHSLYISLTDPLTRSFLIIYINRRAESSHGRKDENEGGRSCCSKGEWEGGGSHPVEERRGTRHMIVQYHTVVSDCFLIIVSRTVNTSFHTRVDFFVNCNLFLFHTLSMNPYTCFCIYIYLSINLFVYPSHTHSLLSNNQSPSQAELLMLSLEAASDSLRVK